MKAAIFDLDGTLVDMSKEYPMKVFGPAFEKFGMKITEAEAHRLWYGDYRDEWLREEKGFDDTEVFWDEYKKIDRVERGKHLVIFNDSDVLGSLRDRGLKIGLVTSSYREATEAKIKFLGFDFDSVVCAAATEGIPPKPDPAGLQRCLSELETRAEDACYVGNSYGDMIAAGRAGVEGIYIERDLSKWQESGRGIVSLWDVLSRV